MGGLEFKAGFCDHHLVARCGASGGHVWMAWRVGFLLSLGGCVVFEMLPSPRGARAAQRCIVCVVSAGVPPGLAGAGVVDRTASRRVATVWPCCRRVLASRWVWGQAGVSFRWLFLFRWFVCASGGKRELGLGCGGKIGRAHV